MAKQRKIAYGIAEDGISLKLASLTREGSQISLQALEQVELDRSLYQHPDEKTPEVESAPTEDINLDDFTTDNVASYKIQPYEALFRNYSMNQGILSINTFEEQVIKLPINTPDLTQKQKNKLIKENIPRVDFKSGQYQSSIVTINDQSELWIHHGSNRLLDILEESATINKFKYYYQLADANEIALANLFIQNQPPDSTETFMVLYLGIEYRRALLFEGNKWTFSLPIHVSQHQSDIDIIYSKLSLAMDEAHITDPKYLLICGDYCNEDTVIFLRNQLPNTNVTMWELPALFLDAETTQVYDAAQVARFILPIALAWKSLTFDHAGCIRSNFLPYYIIEGQKVFKIAWHGYVMLALLFISTLYITKTLYQLQFDLQQEKYKNKELYAEYTSKKDQAEKMMTMAKAIDIQTANIEVIKSLLLGKNPWTEIITRLNSSIQSHPISWITNLRKSSGGFQITGVTTNRPNVVVFSNLFPSGSITKVFNRQIRSFSVWEFEINYKYPDVNWFEMMEADAQQLRKYQALKTDSSKDSKQVGTTKNQTNAGKDDDAPNSISQKADKLKQSNSPQDNVVKVQKATIDIPTPPKSLLSHNEDPDVKSFKDIITAFNQGQDWLMIDLGVKFINNFPRSPLNSYVRWYLSYRAWQKKEYDRPMLWLEPIIKNPDATKPYALLLLGVVARDSGDKVRAEEFWKMVIQDYPQHQVTKTARKLLNEKR